MGKKKKKKSQETLVVESASSSSEIDISQTEDLTEDFSQFLDACRYGRVEEVRTYITEHVAEMTESLRLQHFALYYTLAIPFLMPAQYKKPGEENELPTAYHEGHFATVDFLLETFSSLNLNQRSCSPSSKEKNHQFYVTSAIFFASSAMLDKLIQKGASLDVKLAHTDLLDMIIHGLENKDFHERHESEQILLLLLRENEKKEIFSKEYLEAGFYQAFEQSCFRLTTLFLHHKIGSLEVGDLKVIGRLLISHVQELFYLKTSKESSYSHFLNEEKKELDNLIDAAINYFTEQQDAIKLFTVLSQAIDLFSNVVKIMPSVAKKGSEDFEYNKIYVDILTHYIKLLEKYYQVFFDKEFCSDDLSKNRQNEKKGKKDKGGKKGNKSTSLISSGVVAKQMASTSSPDPVLPSTDKKEEAQVSVNPEGKTETGNQTSSVEEKEDEQGSVDLSHESDQELQDPLSSSTSTSAHDLDVSSMIDDQSDNQAPLTPEVYDSQEVRIKKLLESETVSFIFEVILEQKGEAYLTGGAIRDLLSKQKSRDFDYITNLSAAAIYDAFKKKGCSVRSSQVMPNLITIEYEGVHIDLVCNRPLNLYEDAMTKDFRCNALYLNKEGQLIEILPGSIEDAKNSVLTPTSSWQTILSVPECFPREYNHFWYLDKNPYRIMRTIEFAMRGFGINDIHHFRACARTIFLSQKSENTKFQIQRIVDVSKNIQEKQVFLNHLVGCGLMDGPSRMGFCSEASINAKNILSAIRHSFPVPQIVYAYPRAGFFPANPAGYLPSPAFTP